MEIVPRGYARLEGLSRYFTGKPCARNHIAERYVSSGICVECLKESNIRARARKERVRGRQYLHTTFIFERASRIERKAAIELMKDQRWHEHALKLLREGTQELRRKYFDLATGYER